MNWFVLATLPMCLAAAGCTIALEPGEPQCETTKDCDARGFSGAMCVNQVCEAAPVVDPIWGCLGNVVEPVPDKTKKVALSVRLAFASGGAVKMATVDVCDKLDPGCAGSNAELPKGLSPDADGLVKLSVPQGFDGFVRIAGPEIMDSRVFVGRPIVTPPAVKEVQLLRPFDYTTLAAFAKLTIDDTRGSAILLAVDCQGESASGVRFASPNADATSQEFYLINQAPTPPPTATETDVDGFGGFFNLPAGSAIAKTFRAEDDVYVGESSFHIIANTISYVQIAPTPK